MEWIFSILCLTAVILLGIMLWDSNRFVTVHYRIADERIRRERRFVLLADLHNKEYGTGNAKLLQAIYRVKPDAVLVAGDLMTSVPEKSMEAAKALMAELAREYPVYYANGNHEYRIYHQVKKYGKMGSKYRKSLLKSGVTLLENQRISLPEANLEICGLDIPAEKYRKFNEGQLTVKELEAYLGKAGKNCYTILLAHNPAWFQGYRDWGADLTLSGHVHGGVMRLPFLGGVISTSYRLFPRYDGGIFLENGKRMIVSRGLGTHTVPVRLFNPAELVVIELVPTEEGEN